MGKEKKSFNWSKYENGGYNEIRKLAELLKPVICQLGNPYRMKRRGMHYYPLKWMALLAVMIFMSLSEREYVNWLKTNMWQIELAELPNIPDRG